VRDLWRKSNQNSIRAVLVISPNILRTRSENHLVRTIKTENLEFFDPVAKDTTGFHLQQTTLNWKLQNRRTKEQPRNQVWAPSTGLCRDEWENSVGRCARDWITEQTWDWAGSLCGCANCWNQIARAAKVPNRETTRSRPKQQAQVNSCRCCVYTCEKSTGARAKTRWPKH
jgi:hypothetical protein